MEKMFLDKNNQLTSMNNKFIDENKALENKNMSLVHNNNQLKSDVFILDKNNSDFLSNITDLNIRCECNLKENEELKKQLLNSKEDYINLSERVNMIMDENITNKNKIKDYEDSNDKLLYELASRKHELEENSNIISTLNNN